MTLDGGRETEACCRRWTRQEEVRAHATSCLCSDSKSQSPWQWVCRRVVIIRCTVSSGGKSKSVLLLGVESDGGDGAGG